MDAAIKFKFCTQMYYRKLFPADQKIMPTEYNSREKFTLPTYIMCCEMKM